MPDVPWLAAAAFAYTFLAVAASNDRLLPDQLRTLLLTLFRSQSNLVALALVALAIHICYAGFVVVLAKKRGYNAKATSWWAAVSFIFGFLGVKMVLEKE